MTTEKRDKLILVLNTIKTLLETVLKRNLATSIVLGLITLAVDILMEDEGKP